MWKIIKNGSDYPILIYRPKHKRPINKKNLLETCCFFSPELNIESLNALGAQIIAPQLTNAENARATAAARRTTDNSDAAQLAAPVENAALQSVTPNHLRGQVTFLFLFIMNVVGMGLGPLVIASFTDLIFSEANIRYSIFLSAILMGPPAVVIFWLGMKPYGRAMEAGGVLPPPPKIAAK